jgi:hypothetical protein
MSDFRCADCLVNTAAIGDYYIVHDTVWAAAGMAETDGMLCLDCLANRLGRPLQFSDFPLLPINLKRSIQQAIIKSQYVRVR